MIEIHSLTKSFEKIKAVDEVSVTIKDNIVFGLIGTNGAGKSTVLRMISGVLKPDSGMQQRVTLRRPPGTWRG